MIAGSCPGRRLQSLLEESGSRDEVDELAHHLENCPDCRETLLDLAAPADLWSCAAQGLRDEARAEPALHHLVARLKEETPVRAEDDDLSFLTPADKFGVLGLLDHYEMQEVIGRGGMGVVFKAVDPSLNRIVAIKVLDPALAGNATARRRFSRETQAAAAVCHDHIVAVHAVSEVNGLPYLVMQYIAGESLQARLEREGPLPVAEVVRIGLQTASGLSAAHAQGLIHRDIKPANLLLENGLCRVKITDFGLARMSDDVGLTQHGVVAGTPEYMAPEQARAEVVDHRADLFSLGSVLYACCTGRPPFRGSTALAVLSQVGDTEPVPIRSLNPNISAWLEAFIARLMVKDPDRRFASAAEAVALLEDYLAHLRQPLTVPAPELPACLRTESSAASFSNLRTRNIKQRLKYAWLTVLLLCLAGLGLSFLPLAQVVPPQQEPPAAEPALRQFYQDFRGGHALHPSLRLEGPEDVADMSRFEAEGFRITLPAGRPRNNPAEVVTSFALSGDFEITGSYELLSATRPTKGYGVGITLNIADSKARNKFAKVVRNILPQKGNVFQSQYWVNGPRHDFQERTKPTASRLGQLCLVRKGSVLHCLAADGLGGDFQEIYSQNQFGTEDMGHVLLGVTDSGSPGFAVDVRLLDFKVRAANFVPKPGATDQISDFAMAPEPTRKAESRKWLASLIIMILLLLTALVIVVVVSRRRHSSDSILPSPAPEEKMQANPAMPSVSLRCSCCAKTLKVKAELAGKKIKCPQCGQTTSVPSIKTTSSGGTA